MTRGFDRTSMTCNGPGYASPRSALVLANLFLLAAAGCPLGFLPPGGGGGDVIDGNLDPEAQSPLGKTSGEPNGSFDEPIIAVFNDQDAAQLVGAVSAVGDLDVFYLGELVPGDFVEIDASTVTSNLDISVALFDDRGRLVAENDDRTPSDLDSQISFVTRHAGNPYYLVVTHSAFAGSGQFRGSYGVDAVVTPGLQPPAPVGQVFLLDFDGGLVDEPSIGIRMDLDPFDAGAIDPAYEGETETIKEVIREIMIQNYERFNVSVLTTDDPPPAEGVSVSTLHFGGFNRSVFGIAENVDLYNGDLCDDAILFTESFTPSVFSARPSAEEMGVAIANVAAHEAGHLLGLNHVSNDLDLMDDRSPADAFLFDQEFMESVLSDDIMPIGTQDGVLLLNEILGPKPDAERSLSSRIKVRQSTFAPGLAESKMIHRRQGGKRFLPSR